MFSESSKKARKADTLDEDIIIGLPKHILCQQILSLLPTRFAVKTSTLSTKWKRLWTKVPRLDFSDWSDQDNGNPEKENAFMQHVENVLYQNNEIRVQIFYLEVNKGCDFPRLKYWLRSIVGREFEKFHLRLNESFYIVNLDVSRDRIYQFPFSFFISKTLVELSLEAMPLKVLKPVVLPKLKTLFLKSVQLLDDDTMDNLLVGSPVLRKLELKRDGWDNAKVIYIRSSALESLHLWNESSEDKDSAYQVVIETPNLRYLYIADYVDLDVVTNDLSSLEEAEIFLQRERGVLEEEAVFNDRVIEFLRNIKHTKRLFLHNETLSFIPRMTWSLFVNLPMFNNVTHLKVEILFEENWPIWFDIFNFTPHLVTFQLEKERVPFEGPWHEPDKPPRCLISSLEDVKIEGFVGAANEMKMVLYLLRNGEVLKQMSIMSVNLPTSWYIYLKRQLSECPKKSSICNVRYTNRRRYWLN